MFEADYEPSSAQVNAVDLHSGSSGSSRNTGVPQRRISRDEMNLAEFPLAVLSKRVDRNVKTLEFQDSIRGKNGELIKRQWVITAADKFGLPTSSDDEVLLGLLKLTVDGEFTSQKVYFTRYELLKILRWTTEGRSYSRLQNAFDRLSGVRIKAANAFFDNEAKSHSTKNFGIIDAYEINDGRDVQHKPSYFIWSEEIFKSFKDGFIKKLDLDFYLDLKSAVSKRLYRYLDKHFWYKARVQQNLFTLAHEKIGISRNYKFASSLKQQLDQAVEELKAHGFLQRCEYLGRGQDTTVVFYAATGQPRIAAQQPPRANAPERSETPAPREFPKLVRVAKEGAAQKLAGAPRSISERHGIPERDSVSEKLVLRGIREQQAQRLVAGCDAESRARIERIIAHFDTLRAAGSHLVSRSPAGFLYRAVENPHRFVLPGDNQKAQQQPIEQAKAARPAQADSHELESLYGMFRLRELGRQRSEIDPGVEREIRSEVRASLANVERLVSKERFEQAVEHGVEERLAKLFALPGFEEWRGKVQ